MTDLLATQIRIPVMDVRAGDFLDVIEPVRWRGPRGGRYRFDGVRFESRVTSVDWAGGRGLVIRSRAYPGIVVPPTIASQATAIVRRKDTT